MPDGFVNFMNNILRLFYRFLIVQLLFAAAGHCVYISGNLFTDMMIVDYWNRRINDRLPVTYNHFLQGGYLNMPSARMGEEGEIGIGYSAVPPYRNYNLRCQLIDRLEVSGSYRVFVGVDDPILTPLGFGDLSDKGVNVKLSLFSPEDSGYNLPGVAVGIDDFLGTQSFKAKYLVLTQVFLDYDLEATLGYGAQRLKGFFGGISWMPFRRCPWPYLNSLSIVAEYDAVRYKNPEVEKHPKGRIKKSPINMGVKYRLWDSIDLSAAYVRGDAWAFSASTYYNLGNTKGFLPKIDDPLPYKAPVNQEPLGWRRPEDVFALDLLYGLQGQGFDLLELCISYNPCNEKTLYAQITNTTYMNECETRNRLNHIFAAVIPSDILQVVAVMQSEGFPIQEYHYDMEYVREYGNHMIGAPELRVLTPMCEVDPPDPCLAECLFRQRRDLWNVEIFPKAHTFFGSAKGKFKYAFGVNLGLNGYIFEDLYYSIRLGYLFVSNLHHLHGVDRLNPSQLPNVRTDIVNYYCQRGITVDEAFVQKTWNLGKGLYTTVAAGLFEEEYGGVASECLYYPVNSCFAVGFEAAILRKRTVSGIGFTNRIRQLHGFVPSYHHFRGSQYFLDMYYEWREAKLDFKVMLGKFLAGDRGARFEVARYFPSGLIVSLWYTATNGRDHINGKDYQDKGVAFSMPLDIFYTYSDVSRWGYGMSAWLRDVGVTSATGLKLYEQIREQRN
ncbi:MAG: YjbH domain-containing protein [Parachlamydiaceae bacterium]|nr:YjbH domain-containing protein [Parachlamydiaceae bacterium]